MKATNSFTAASSAQFFPVGSLRYSVVITPADFSRPAGVNTAPMDEETLFRYWVGFQPVSYAARMACAANFGVVMLKKTFAPEDLSCRIWESTVGSPTSYDASATIIFWCSGPSPSLKPLR